MKETKMNFIDIHCHLHDPRIRPFLESVMARVRKAGIRYMVSCATGEENFTETLDLAENHSEILPCIGIHPWFCGNLQPGWKERLAQSVQNSVCGIGETGLDFVNPDFDREEQIRAFSFHLDLANQLKRPVVIHIRKAWDALIHILKKTGPLQIPGILHSYSGSADLAAQLVPYNLYFSFSGSITRTNAKKAVQVIQAVPRDRILVETDAPDLLPHMEKEVSRHGIFHGGRMINEPSYLPVIACSAARYLSMPLDDFSELVYENSRIVLGPLLV